MPSDTLRVAIVTKGAIRRRLLFLPLPLHFRRKEREERTKMEMGTRPLVAGRMGEWAGQGRTRGRRARGLDVQREERRLQRRSFRVTESARSVGRKWEWT